MVSKSYRDGKTVKVVISEQQELRMTNISRSYKVCTYVSEIGIGGVLQDQKLVRIFSHKLSTTELDYTIIENGMLAII